MSRKQLRVEELSQATLNTIACVCIAMALDGLTRAELLKLRVDHLKAWRNRHSLPACEVDTALQLFGLLQPAQHDQAARMRTRWMWLALLLWLISLVMGAAAFAAPGAS